MSSPRPQRGARRPIAALALIVALAATTAAVCPPDAAALPSDAASPSWERPPHHGHGDHAGHAECHAGDCCGELLQARHAPTVTGLGGAVGLAWAPTITPAVALVGADGDAAEIRDTGPPGHASPIRC